MAILSGYFQFLGVASGLVTKTCEEIPHKAFFRLMNELCTMLNMYVTCSEHEPLSLSISEQCEIVVNFIFFLFRILMDNVKGRKPSDNLVQVQDILKKCTELLDFVLPKLENIGFISSLLGRLGKFQCRRLK